MIVNPIFSHRGDILLRISTGISAVTVSTSPSPSPPSPLSLLFRFLYCCFFKVCSNKSSLSLFDSSASPSSSPSPPLPSQVLHWKCCSLQAIHSSTLAMLQKFTQCHPNAILSENNSTHLKMTARARALHLKHQEQHLQYKDPRPPPNSPPPSILSNFKCQWGPPRLV